MDANTNTDKENTQTQTNSGNESTSTQTDGQNVVSMSQSDFDTLIGRKIGKAKENAVKDLLDSLGLENLDTFKAQISKQKELEEANKTELEKANSVLLEKDNTIKALQDKLSQLENDSNINSIAMKHGIKEVDYLRYELDRASKVDDFNQDEFISKLIETKSHLLGIENYTPSVSNPPSQNNLKGTISRLQFEKMTPSERMEAMRSGKRIA